MDQSGSGGKSSFGFFYLFLQPSDFKFPFYQNLLLLLQLLPEVLF